MKLRSRIVTIWLWLIFVMNIILTVYNAVLIFEQTSITEVIQYGLFSLFALGTALAGVLLLKWSRVGFYILISSNIAYALTVTIISGFDASMIIAGVLSIIISWLILHVRQSGRTAWSYMSGGFDYIHCRHIYQLFVIAMALILLFVTIALVSFRNYDYHDTLDPKEYTGSIGHKPSSEDQEKSVNDTIISYEELSIDQLWKIVEENTHDPEALYRLARYYHKRKIAANSPAVSFWNNTLIPDGDVALFLPSGKRNITSVRFGFVMLARSYASMDENTDPELRVNVQEMLNTIQKGNPGYTY